MHIMVVLDATGSMASDALRNIDGFNEYVEGLKAADATRDAHLSLVTFNSGTGVRIVHRGQPVIDIPPLTQDDYICHYSTPLFDAIGQAIGLVERSARSETEQILFVINTDGEENASREYGKQQIGQLIKEKEQSGYWTFVFLGADLDAWGAQASMGLGMTRGNTVSYDKRYTGAVYSGAVGQTVSLAASGMNSTSDFWQGCNTESFQDPGSEEMLTASEAASLLNTTPQSLAKMRQRNTGPAFHRLGQRTVRYNRRDIDDWLAATRRSTSGGGDD